MTAFTTLLLVVGLVDLPASEPPRRVEVHKLATLTLREAERIDGQTATYLVNLDSRITDHGEWYACDVLAADGLHGTIWSRRGIRDDGKPLRVPGRLRVIRHPATVHDGIRFEGFIELRLVAW